MSTMRSLIRLVEGMGLNEEEDTLGRLAGGLDSLSEQENTLNAQDEMERVQAEIDAKVAALKTGKPTVAKRQRPATFKPGKFDEFFKQVCRAGNMMFDADPDDFDRNDVKDWILRHRNLWKKGSMRVFRTMQVDPSWVEQLQPDTEVGQHWTFELDTNEFHQFSMDMSDLTKPIIIIEADASISDANIPMSVAYNVHFPNENEIFLNLNSEPKIVSIRAYNVETNKVAGQNLRPDLVGLTLRA